MKPYLVWDATARTAVRWPVKGSPTVLVARAQAHAASSPPPGMAVPGKGWHELAAAAALEQQNLSPDGNGHAIRGTYGVPGGEVDPYAGKDRGE
jgi:hypothetical protein